MHATLTEKQIRDVFAPLSHANQEFAQAYPGDRADRQPVHTVYGGAHLFTADLVPKMGAAALAILREYAPNFVTFARALDLPRSEELPHSPTEIEKLVRDLDVYRRELRSDFASWLPLEVYRGVVQKLEREPIEDYRLDFEDGYGNRPDPEEDGHAVSAAQEVAAGMKRGTLPPYIGIRIKPLTEDLRRRSTRTLDLFLSTLVTQSGGVLPANFVVTLPKVTVPEQVQALVSLLELLEKGLSLPSGAVPIEIMVETPQSIIDRGGEVALPKLVARARGRCRGAHFGTYDYTAGCGITAAYQVHSHPACDFARHVMQVSLAGTGVTLSDGATTIMPTPVHRPSPDGPPLTTRQLEENRRAVHAAWRRHYQDVRSSLRHAFYQGWDLHPGQLPSRYAAVFAFFLENLDQARDRLRSFVEKAAQATLVGGVFDDAATGQGLLNYFLRGIGCGAITEAEALAAGLSLDELRTRSFVKILDSRRHGRV